MDKLVKADKHVHGSVSAPVSKSVAHRMLICAALADAPCRVYCRAVNDDIDATVRCLNAMGAVITFDNGCFEVTPIKEPSKEELLDCGESGSTLRFLLPVAAALEADAVFDGRGRLPERPLSPLYELMSERGVGLSAKGRMPLVCKGRLTGESFSIDGGVSSQFITGLLLACPLMAESARVEITGRLESAPYIDITLDCLRSFGVRAQRQGNTITVSGSYRSPRELWVEGDWSSGAFWLSAGVLSKDEVSVSGLSQGSCQGDKKIISCLEALGAEFTVDGQTVTAHPSALKGCTLDCSDIPDLVPILSVAAAFARGETVFTNIARLRAKESDRVEAVCAMLRSFGIETRSEENTLTVIPSRASGTRIDSFCDHRIAMSGAVLALSCGCDAVIENAQCVSKSYPDFFRDLEALTR